MLAENCSVDEALCVAQGTAAKRRLLIWEADGKMAFHRLERANL